MPFLLPLMLQLSFGLSPFQSGMLTFASAGARAPHESDSGAVIRTFGFRRVLIVNALISTLFMGVNGFFTAVTPTPSSSRCCWQAASSARSNSPRQCLGLRGHPAGPDEPGYELRERNAAGVALPGRRHWRADPAGSSGLRGESRFHEAISRWLLDCRRDRGAFGDIVPALAERSREELACRPGGHRCAGCFGGQREGGSSRASINRTAAEFRGIAKE